MSTVNAKTERISVNGKLRASASQLIKSLGRLKPPILATPLAPAANPAPSLPVNDQRAEICAQIEMAARNGYVPDAHVLSLYGCCVAELAEARQQVGEAEAAYQASLMRLDAMFPEPPAPLPEPPAPAPRRVYHRLGEVLGERDQKIPLH